MQAQIESEMKIRTMKVGAVGETNGSASGKGEGPQAIVSFVNDASLIVQEDAPVRDTGT